MCVVATALTFSSWNGQVYADSHEQPVDESTDLTVEPTTAEGESADEVIVE